MTSATADARVGGDLTHLSFKGTSAYRPIRRNEFVDPGQQNGAREIGWRGTADPMILQSTASANAENRLRPSTTAQSERGLRGRLSKDHAVGLEMS